MFEPQPVPLSELFKLTRVAIRAIFHNEKGEILVVHHSNGLILLPGGHVEFSKDASPEGENLMEILMHTMKREAYEELSIPIETWSGLDFVPLTIVPWLPLVAGTNDYKIDLVGSVACPTDFPIQSGNEVVSCEWVNPIDVLKNPNLPGNIEVAIHTFVGYESS